MRVRGLSGCLFMAVVGRGRIGLEICVGIFVDGIRWEL